MEIKYKGLKCDNCSYRDDNVEWEDYKKSIDKACPECGHNLLTLEDYNKCLKIINIIINNFTKWFNPFYYLRRYILHDMNWLTFDFEYIFKNKKKV